MTPQERDEWWNKTVAAIQQRDPRVHVALLTALVLRTGELTQEANGKTTTVVRMSIEELRHTVEQYYFACRSPEYGVLMIEALAKGDVDGGVPPDAGTPGPGPARRRS